MSAKYYSTIGLEIHAELKTASKMFCACRNNPDETNPNTNICPVCMAHPGALPVPNMEAIKSVIKVGLSINGNIANFTEFDRKNYFYPDIPKGYQISQYKYPIVSGGRLGDFDITRIHLEEDTANSKHDRGDFTLVDFNRAGVPLMELVTEPHTFETPEEASRAASKFAKELQLLLWYLGVSDANMEKGEMRVEANISLSPDKEKYGTKVEVKNLNSFRSAERAILFELERMKKLYESGKESEIVQETRGWDEIKQSTFSQRSKENAQDYRYFPEPDIPKFYLKEIFGENYEKIGELPELPSQKRETLISNYKVTEKEAEIYINTPNLLKDFEKTTREIQNKKVNDVLKNIKIANNLYISSTLGILNENPEAHLPSPIEMANLSGMFSEGIINSTSAKIILSELMTTENKTAEKIAEEKNLIQKNDEGAIKEIVQKVIDANASVVAEYKAGKEASIQFLVGQVMKESKGSANPGIAMKILKELI